MSCLVAPSDGSFCTMGLFTFGLDLFLLIVLTHLSYTTPAVLSIALTRSTSLGRTNSNKSSCTHISIDTSNSSASNLARRYSTALPLLVTIGTTRSGCTVSQYHSLCRMLLIAPVLLSSYHPLWHIHVDGPASSGVSQTSATLHLAIYT